MHRLTLSLFILASSAVCVRGAETSITVEQIKNLQSVAVADDGRILIGVSAQDGRDSEGAVLVVRAGIPTPYAKGLDDPRAIVTFQDSVFVAGKHRVWKIDRGGKAEVFAGEKSPPEFRSLTALAVDFQKGTLYAADAGDGGGGAIYRISVRRSVDVIVDEKTRPELGTPSGLVLDGAAHLLVSDSKSGTVNRVKLADGSIERIIDGLPGAAGLAFDPYGRLFIADRQQGRLFAVPRPGQKPVELAGRFQSVDGIGADRARSAILVADAKAGALSTVPIAIPGAELDETPLLIEAVHAFDKLQWSGWTGETERGIPAPFRPLVLTHAGDGSNRVFVATEQGVIHVFPNDQNVRRTRVFLDLQDRVKYDDKQNEEGFLGLAFHPRYSRTGEFFVFYTPQKASSPHTNLVSRFRVRADDPNQADPSSEEILLRIEHPFWNHDGGTLCFGPDGYLYIALGDGGAANDPFRNGQNLQTLLGKILRIDIDRKDGSKPYGIPKDNPFLDRSDARPEIWCYGLRNVWRFGFDRKTGVGWAADVGQDLWEEIDLLAPGGNYGWNLREGLHPFGKNGVGPRKDLIDPIWEYHHSIGKSITGGSVYRGAKLPELSGAYLYADYVSGAIRALRYDPVKKRVVANYPVHGPNLPVLSFGEDEGGEPYFLIVAADGQGIYRFERSKTAAKSQR